LKLKERLKQGEANIDSNAAKVVEKLEKNKNKAMQKIFEKVRKINKVKA
jgi:hypothetical protein